MGGYGAWEKGRKRTRKGCMATKREAGKTDRLQVVSSRKTRKVFVKEDWKSDDGDGIRIMISFYASSGHQ